MLHIEMASFEERCQEGINLFGRGSDLVSIDAQKDVRDGEGEAFIAI